ncbi:MULTISPECIES: hypothetical protein [Staphylococcus]|uniref:hypothetical protein n=1 Tax=Staphylococcus TaxID=1279 RepID=UPI0008A601A3|nr:MULTISPECIES: hypothetical protein [Staphylococcus]MDT4011068.1 hypothetical protein [Staphylococcus simulans]OFJ75500.1 hypothetical protein HMPREF2846_12790 [Staphylococcus sp. HMSC056G08]
MKINIADALTKRLGKLEGNFKHYADDMAYLTLVSGIDKSLKDLLGIQVLRQALAETVAREMSRLDLAVLDQNEMTDMVKLRTVYVHDFEPSASGQAGHAVSTIQRDFTEHLKKMTNPPKSWVYNVSDQTKFHYAAVYIDVKAKKDFEIPETKSAFLKQYPELKDADLIYKSIQNHQQERDHSIEEIVEEPIQTNVIEPALTEHTDLQSRQSDVQTIYKGEYKDFQVTVYLQVLELGYHLDEEQNEELETTLTTDDKGEVIAVGELEEEFTAVKEEPAKEEKISSENEPSEDDKSASESSEEKEKKQEDKEKVESKDKKDKETKEKKDKKDKDKKGKGKKDDKDDKDNKDKKSKKKDNKKEDKKEDSKDKKKKDKKKKDKKKKKK